MLTPQDLALAYDRHVAALWRGETDTTLAFATWLVPFWVDDGPPEPVDYPDAVSFLRGAGRGIRWYCIDTDIVGYLPGCPNGCYRVPNVIPANVRSFSPAPGTSVDRRWWPTSWSAREETG